MSIAFSFYSNPSSLDATIQSSHAYTLKASDQEVAVLALATLANILAFSDTLLLADIAVVDSLATSLQALMLTLRTSQQRPQRFFCLYLYLYQYILAFIHLDYHTHICICLLSYSDLLYL